MTNATEPEPIYADEVRYIKLGRGGVWAALSVSGGELHFGYRGIPHEICVARNWKGVAELLAPTRKSSNAVSSGLREIREFYELGSNCLWITTHGGYLWWAFAAPEVNWFGGGDNAGARFRKTIGPWRKNDLRGRPLFLNQLSSKLTQVAGYRGTICDVKHEDYLLRRINGIVEPVVAEAEAARASMIIVAQKMISGLHWADFETLTDLIFARSGWQRLTMVGRDADIDILFGQPTTNEIAFVQVKSRAGQAELDDYYDRFINSDADRLFFICHTPAGTLVRPDDKVVHLWAERELAEVVVRHGLFDWLMQHSG